jgi:hypothetical protein
MPLTASFPLTSLLSIPRRARPRLVTRRAVVIVPTVTVPRVDVIRGHLVLAGEGAALGIAAVPARRGA